ncbi:PREDICTED: HEAT repeat-containing protein 3 [Rhagoletis zephyria]|uniref:HEAT repeat-containing protein 3 n=1 Tax=Rhagoletis zephyria TaxID=28612 RepID=UPI00081174DE|nr:PREDICTED: HEAT repeat-containing protein 3 [Rhagoletis zephyria]
MGKTRRNRVRHIANSNPLGIASINDLLNGDEDSMDNGLGPVDSMREQLLTANVEEKLNALQSLAVLVQSGKKDKLAAICESDIIRITAPYLYDRDQPLRNAAAGALRNFTVCVPEVCDIFVEQDVLTPLLALLGEYAQDDDWVPSFDNAMGGQLDIRSDTFLQAINLLWNLCESSMAALESFNQTQLIGGLIRCLDHTVFGLDIAISVAQCMLVVSESNARVWNALTQHIKALLSLLEITGGFGHHYLRSLGAGILSNVPALAAAYPINILNCLAQTLAVDQQEALSNVLNARVNNERNECIPVLDINMETEEEETEEAAALRRRRQELPTPAEIAIKEVGNLLDAHRVAAEIITNLVSSDDEEWVDSDGEDASEGEGVVDCEIENANSNGDIQDGDKLPAELVEMIKSLGIVQKLWQKAQVLPDNVAQSLREVNLGLVMKAKNLRISSLLCLQNLCNALSPNEMGGAKAIYDVWVELGQQVFKGAQDVAVMEPATSLMRAALERLKTNKELFNQMAENDLELIFNGVKNCSVAEIRANWLRMLGTLGCLLPETLVRIIITFIIEACAEEEDVWTISEALDALMDMFADNDWPKMIVELNLPEVLKKLEKMFKNKMRQQRRELKDRYPAVQTVRINLTRFIRYMETEADKYVINS